MAKRKPPLRRSHYDPVRAPLPRALLDEVRLRKLGRRLGYTVWIVDGAVLRARVDIDFALGGNPARYGYIPAGEIWIEWTGSWLDVAAIFAHEAAEDKAMRAGHAYEAAHRDALVVEEQVRRAGEDTPFGFAENPGDFPLVITGDDVAAVLAAQPNNSGKSPEWLKDRWVASTQFHLMPVYVGLNELGVSPGKTGETRSAGQPIIVDANINGVARGAGGLGGAAPDFLVLDGQNRVVAARRDGPRTALLAYVGDRILDAVRAQMHKAEAIFAEVDEVAADFVAGRAPIGPLRFYVARGLMTQAELEGLRAARRVGSSANPGEPPRMCTVCAGCGVVLVEGPVGPDGLVSHGICPVCLKKYGFSDEDIAAITADDRQSPAAEKNPAKMKRIRATQAWRNRMHKRILKHQVALRRMRAVEQTSEGLVFECLECSKRHEYIYIHPDGQILRPGTAFWTVRYQGDPNGFTRGYCPYCSGTKKNPKVADEIHTAAEETAEEIAEHEHYGFWLSPDGRVFVVEAAYEHGEVASEIVDCVLGDSGVGNVNAEFHLEQLGWLRCAGLPHELVVLRGILPGHARAAALTQRQLDVLFDLQRALPYASGRAAVGRFIQREIELLDRGLLDHGVENPGEPLPSLKKRLLALRPLLAAAAQGVYDDWAQDEEGVDDLLGVGGICQDVADAFADVLSQAGIDVAIMDNAGMGEQHVWAVAYDEPEGKAFVVDIPPNVYETGGGYTWRKRADVEFEPSDVVIEDVSGDFDPYALD